MSNTVVESPPTTPGRPPSRTTGDAAALVFRRRVRLIDRFARTLIAVSGWGIIAAVLGIGAFLVLETVPLFLGARIGAGVSQPVLSAGAPAHLVIVDEHQERAVVLGPEPVLTAWSLDPDAPGKEQVPLPEFEGRTVTAVSRVSHQRTVAVAASSGEVWLGRIGLDTVFEGSDRRITLSVAADAVVQAAPGRRITGLSFRGDADNGVLAAIVEDAYVVVVRLSVTEPIIGPARRSQDSVSIPMDELRRPTALAVNESGTQLVTGTSSGRLARWRLPVSGPAERLESVSAVSDGSVTALAYLLGDRSIVAGGSDGSVATWSLVRNDAATDGWEFTRFHRFPAHGTPVTSITPSPRDKGFLTGSTDGLVRLHYMTVERTLGEFRLAGGPEAADFAPKANGAVFVDAGGALRHWTIHNPHPEFSWRALFGKIWYEGYPEPDYIWQSTGGTDDFESKFSLVPLVFGTMKGTFYALLFAVPLALFGALYCSQFLEKRLRNPVKSTVELMAALPSVVLGFVAGVVLSPLVQSRIVTVLILPVFVPLVALGGMVLSRYAAPAPIRRFAAAHEFWTLTAWALAGGIAAWWAGPLIERLAFGGDFETWLAQATGSHYDQRNSLVVGWAMGFAVVPIIFTICEDAFSAVPRHLVGASLACGASLWQTAWRVVLPAAGSGVFSAVMVGFGRAVGETMIVLMATGNTPVLDWSIFNGFRALSANIAVEIPEAPYGGTLYRVLFIAALLLFSITFVVNTVAELVRIRLRRQLQGL